MQVFRQADISFASLLDDVRYGRNPAGALATLVARCSRPLPCDDGIKPTRLFGRNAQVRVLRCRALSCHCHCACC